MELYFVIKLVGLINNAKGFKACLLSMFRFGDIYQLFLVRVGRTAHGPPLRTAPLPRKPWTTKSERVSCFVGLKGHFFNPCYLSLFVILVSSLDPPRRGSAFLHPFTRWGNLKNQFVFLDILFIIFLSSLLFFFFLTSSTAALPLSSQFLSAMKNKIKDIL